MRQESGKKRIKLLAAIALPVVFIIAVKKGSLKIHITYPPEKYVTSVTEEEVKFEVVDTVSGVDEVYVNGRGVRVNESGVYAVSVTLVEGENIVTIRAVDKAGHTAEATRRIILDTEPPVISVYFPSDGYETFAESITVRG